MTYQIYSEQDGRVVGRGYSTMQQALLFMNVFDPEGTTPLLIKSEDEAVDVEGELYLPTPVRSALAFTVQIQTDSGWHPYIHTDDMEDALEAMESVVHTLRSPSRVIENGENGNIVQEKFPYFNDWPEAEDVVKTFDWRQDGF